MNGSEVAGLILGVLALVGLAALIVGKYKTGLDKSTIESYKNALDARQAELDAVKDENADLRNELAKLQTTVDAQSEQIRVLTNTVNARTEILELSAMAVQQAQIAQTHHIEVMDALKNLAGLVGGTRGTEGAAGAN